MEIKSTKVDKSKLRNYRMEINRIKREQQYCHDNKHRSAHGYSGIFFKVVLQLYKSRFFAKSYTHFAVSYRRQSSGRCDKRSRAEVVADRADEVL